MASRPKKRASKRQARAASRALQAGPLPKGFPKPESVDPTVEARVAYCVRLLAAHRWQYEITHRTLAAAWGVTPVTIRGYAAEAARAWKSLFTDEEREGLRVTFAESFRRIARKAEQSGRYAAACGALELEAQYLGVAPQKITRSEITGKDGGPVAIAGPVIMIPPEDDDDDRSGGGGAAPAAAAAP